MSQGLRAGLLALLYLLCSPLAADDRFRVPVTGVRAALGEISQLTRVQGGIEAVSAPEIVGKVAAEIEEVLVDEGDRVEAGQLLARLDDEAFRLDKEGAQADIRRLQVLLQNQRDNLERDRSLIGKKLISEAQLDDARSAVEQTQAQLAQARSLLDKARYQLSHTRILAPIGGEIQNRSVSRGDYVNPNSPNSRALFQIVDVDHLRARLFFPEDLARRIARGTPATLIRDGARVETRIAKTLPMLDSGTRALEALADFDNLPGWQPGESVAAEVVLARHQRAVVVPEAVLVQRPAGLVVYRLEGDKAREVAVTTGIRQDDRVEILSGVGKGDLLALDGASYLSDGAAVEIKGETP